MGKKGKKGQAGKPKKLTPKDVGKRLNALAKNLEEELEVPTCSNHFPRPRTAPSVSCHFLECRKIQLIKLAVGT